MLEIPDTYVAECWMQNLPLHRSRGRIGQQLCNQPVEAITVRWGLYVCGESVVGLGESVVGAGGRRELVVGIGRRMVV